MAHWGAYQMMIQCGRASGDLVVEILGLSGLALLALERGELRFVFDLASQGIERLDRAGSLPPLAAAVYGEIGQVYYHWHQLEQAHSHFLRAIQVSAFSGYSDAEIYHGVILSRLFQMAGKLPAATREIQRVTDRMKVDAPAQVREEVIAQLVRVQLAGNQLVEAEAVLIAEGFSHRGVFAIPDPAQSIDRPMGLLYSSALRVQLFRAQVAGDKAGLEKALALASRLVDMAQRRSYIPVALETLLLRAQIHAEMRNDEASIADYIRALELGEPEGFVSLFVEGGAPVAEALTHLSTGSRLDGAFPAYVRRILAACGPEPARSRSTAAPAPIDVEEAMPLITPLTERELDVLRWMARGLKYAEIAERLYISVNTVRFHVKTIYGKLYVNNRTQAIERANQLLLL